MYRLSSYLLIAGAVLAAAPLSAQIVRVGQTVTGRLEASDPAMNDGERYDRYVLAGRGGERVVVRLSSEDFDTELFVGAVRGRFDDMAVNDDAGSGTNSYLVYTLDATGRAEVYAAGLSAEDLGAYELVTAPWRDPVGAPISVGQAVTGSLDATDFQAVNGREDRYTLRGAAGQTVTISMAAEGFDTQLSIGQQRGEGWDEIAGNDDRGEGTNSQIVHTFERAGVIEIAAFGFEGTGSGAYTLRVEQGDVAAPEADFIGVGSADTQADTAIAVETLRPGTPVGGTLTDRHPVLEDGSHYHDYVYEGREDERITIDLSSDDFDAVAAVGTGLGDEFRGLQSDDDSGEGRDARLVVVLPHSGSFTIRVNTLHAGETGAYVLNVQSRR